MVQKLKWWSLVGSLFIIVLAFGAYGYIISCLVSFQYWDQLLTSVAYSSSSILIILVLVLFWGINLFAETKKWQTLLLPYCSLSVVSAFRQVLAGTVTAVGSPARIAEMGGRMALLAPQYRVNAAIMTSIGGLMQNLIILIGGAIVLILPRSPLLHFIQTSDYALHEYLGLLMLVFGVLFTIAYKFWGNKMRLYLATLTKLSFRVVLMSFFWTIIRYLVYNVQLYFWMSFLGISLSIESFFYYSPLYYMLITIIPSYILIDMGIRGTVALLLFASIGISEPLIVGAIFAQWFSNVVFPTLWGTVILLRYKVIKQ